MSSRVATFWKRFFEDWRAGDPVTFSSVSAKGNHKIIYYGFILSISLAYKKYGKRIEVGVVTRTYWNGTTLSARNIYFLRPDRISVWKHPIERPPEVDEAIALRECFNVR